MPWEIQPSVLNVVKKIKILNIEPLLTLMNNVVEVRSLAQCFGFTSYYYVLRYRAEPRLFPFLFFVRAKSRNIKLKGMYDKTYYLLFNYLN